MGKLLEKVVAEELSLFCETHLKLHKGQMGARKNRCAIDATAIMIENVHESWDEGKVAGALFMDVKGAFDYVSRVKLAQRMRELKIDNDLTGWTQSFLTDRKVKLVIDGHANLEKGVETGIPQGSPVSPILFLIYISGVFDAVTTISPNALSLSFMDDLGFLVDGKSIHEIAANLEKIGEVLLRWGVSNAVTYDIAKIEAIFFSKSRKSRLKEEMSAKVLTFGGHNIKFNDRATRWLGIWLDSGLTFATHINERLKKAHAAQARIRGLTKSYGLPPGLVRKIEIAAVQSIALFGAEIWWRGQKTHQEELQKLLNKQARAITGMYQSTPIGPLMSESGLVPARMMLDYRQQKYALRLLTLPDGHLAKDILPITLRIGDGNAQPGDQPVGDAIWASHQKVKNYGQHLARQV